MSEASSYMNRAQPFIMITIWNSQSWRYQPVPFSGGHSGLAFTRSQITCPAVAEAMLRRIQRQEVE
jgi:hypothetical protein